MNDDIFSHKQVKTVSSFSELISTSFQGEKNAICWKRNLEGDFKEIVSKLQLREDITEISIDDLQKLKLSESGKIAREIIIRDLINLTDSGAMPSLNLLKKYNRDEEYDFISTDVYSFHVDQSIIESDTYLCTYYGNSGDIVSNNQADKKILIPEIRQELRKLHHGSDSEFDCFLKENFFDLHYQLKPNAKPLNLGLGNLWRLAIEHPSQKVLPCIHRAPKEGENECRLLLIC